MCQSVTQEAGARTNNRNSFWKQRRYILVLMLFLGTANMLINRTNLSVAIVAMTRKNNDEAFNWNSREQGIILGSYFYGYILTQLPGGILTQYIPAHHIFGVSIGIASVLMLLTPEAASAGFMALAALRVLEGLFLGMVLPALMVIQTNWIPPIERARMSVICDVGTYVGTIIALPGSGFLNDYFGWKSIFYVFGIFGIIWCIVWFLIIKECPEKDPWISEEERNYILKDIQNTASSSVVMKPIPWCAMIKSGPVWAILCALFAHCWGNYTLLTQMPLYLSDTMNINLRSNGLLSCLPYILTSLLGPISGFVSDMTRKKELISKLNVRRFFACFAFCIQCIFLTAAAYLMTPAASIACLTVAMGFASIAFTGFGPNVLDISGSLSGITFGLINTIAGISGVLSPLLSGFLVQSHSEAEWRVVFYIAGVIYLTCATIYWLMASIEVQHWAKPSVKSEEMTPMKDTTINSI